MVNTVLRNLISNAIKFSYVNGVVKVTARQSGSEMIKIEITDQGTGMSDQTMSFLFRLDNKSLAKGTFGEEGTGLGLILCKEFIEKNNGKIEAASRLGHGSTFTIFLPACTAMVDDDALMAPRPITKIGPSEHRLPILVVEDNPINQKIVAAVLKKNGFDTTLTLNGAEALMALAQHPYRIILMDIEMPIMDGFTAVKKIRTMPKYDSILIYAMTGHDSELEVDQLLKMGFSGILGKPFDVHAFLNLIDEIRLSSKLQ